ncbi:MAG TPA: hypothetical protein VNS09_05655 [Solirubrobacter sp.]|nr:hypothetical protein [Solirubrobacter sp.]
MLADLDLLVITVYYAADDMLPARAENARRRVTDPEIVTLAVAQAVLDIPSDRALLRAAARQLRELFAQLPRQDGYWKRRARLAEAIEALMAAFARDSPGYRDSIVLLDSTPRGVRALGRNRAPLAAGRRVLTRPLPESLQVVLGDAAAPARRPRRHDPRRHPRPSRSQGA